MSCHIIDINRAKSITVVIPALDAASYLPRVLQAVEGQSVPPREVVIVDSSRGRETEAVIRSWQSRVPLRYHRVPVAFPGHARNIGAGLATSDWIAFLDCRTVPFPDWLERTLAVSARDGADFVGALLQSEADSFFKKCVLAATYGHARVRSLPGSLVLKRVFEATGGFLPHVRAAEDIEWLGRLERLGVKISTVEKPVLTYEGFPATLRAAVRKWHLNNISAARIDVCKSQKISYIALFVLLFVLVFKWNYLFAHWREDSAWYIPNITKIFVACMTAVYLVYRGVVRPVRNKVPFSFLMPWRWLAVCCVGACLDLAKAPGMLLGAWIMIKRRVVGRPLQAVGNKGGSN